MGRNDVKNVQMKGLDLLRKKAIFQGCKSHKLAFKTLKSIQSG